MEKAAQEYAEEAAKLAAISQTAPKPGQQSKTKSKTTRAKPRKRTETPEDDFWVRAGLDNDPFGCKASQAQMNLSCNPAGFVVKHGLSLSKIPKSGCYLAKPEHPMDQILVKTRT